MTDEFHPLKNMQYSVGSLKKKPATITKADWDMDISNENKPQSSNENDVQISYPGKRQGKHKY